MEVLGRRAPIRRYCRESFLTKTAYQQTRKHRQTEKKPPFTQHFNGVPTTAHGTRPMMMFGSALEQIK